MRRIFKQAEPAELTVWRAAIRPIGTIPAWNLLPNPPSGAMRSQLAHEQRGLCCYCAGTIGRGNFHIEHFCPRSVDVSLTYRWSNLLASCQGVGREVANTRRHCGAAKDDWFIQNVTVSPLRAGVEALFRFPLSGKVYPTKTLEDDKYQHVSLTIEKLNLNAASLVARRAEILKQAALDVTEMSRDDWRDHYLSEHSGTLQEFWPALNYNYAKIWATSFGD